MLIEEIRLFQLKTGTRVYALAYSEGRLGKAQTSKDGLYHFLSAVFTKDFASTNNLTSSRTLYPKL